MDATEDLDRSVVPDDEPRLIGRVHKLATDDVTGEAKGYGFVRVTDGRDYVEYFFHRRAFVRAGQFDTVRVGQRLRFVHRPTAKGPRAISVEVVEGE